MMTNTESSTRNRFPTALKGASYADKFALVLTIVTLACLGLLSVTFTPEASLSLHRSTTRLLEQNRQFSDEQDGNSDSGDYSSFSCYYIFDQFPDPGQDQCNFARTCNGGDGLWAPFIFCSKNFSTFSLACLISPFMVLWMVLLFRMLASSAEDFFSPSLEMFSMKLGLPPRFAGVSLLALGNGAADVSATVSAITGDPVKGYELSLGALSGAAMFISCVVSAVVVLAAQGVPCRGALVRDVTMLVITVLVVWQQLGKGSVGPDTMTIFLSLYMVFVILVLVADIYHRAVVVPRIAAAAQERERARQLEAQHLHESNYSAVQASEQPTPITQGRFAAAITALSNYDNDDTGPSGWGVESEELTQDRPVVLRGTHGILGGGDGVQEVEQSDYHMLDVDHACVQPGTGGVPAGSWTAAVGDGWQELLEHASSSWEEILWSRDIHSVSKVLLICEFPFTVLRKITIPIPCEGHYVRPLVALALVLSPVWFVYYLWNGHEYNALQGSGVIVFLVIWGCIATAGLCVLRFAPAGDGVIALPIATPIALYGFLIAATWIDTIADALVSLLNFIGIILRIPGPVIGLTILAWGNSMGDLSANVTMARKGLGNMAMTACFAGPVFNILVGLGLGFGALLAETGEGAAAVKLSPSIVTGFLFLAVNGAVILAVGLVFGVHGRIDVSYGYVAIVLYGVYLATSLTMQYSKYGDS